LLIQDRLLRLMDVPHKMVNHLGGAVRAGERRTMAAVGRVH
jgi:hypothetical protein